MKSSRPFPETLTELMDAQGIGTRELARRCGDWGAPPAISFLRRGLMKPSKKAMEEIAQALNVPVETFVEYRLAVARDRLDPNEVGLDQALKNLAKMGD